MLGFARDIGIDLGTANVLIYQRGRGIVLREPSVVALNKATREPRAFGEEARQMLGRTPTALMAVHPLRDGVIADYTNTEHMLRHYIRKVCGARFNRPRVVVSVPSNVTSVERRAVLGATLAAGAKEAYPIEEPMAAALGAGLKIGDADGNMIIDIGSGTTDVAVISLGGTVKSDSIRVGGTKLDEAIHRYIQREYNLTVGERSAEEIKIGVGAVFHLEEELAMEVKGRNMLDGLPKTIVVTSTLMRAALIEPVQHIVARARRVLERTPPELASDIAINGIVLTGGGALLRGLDLLLERETGLPVRVAEDPLSCVAIGAGKALDHLEMLSETHFDYAGNIGESNTSRMRTVS